MTQPSAQPKTIAIVGSGFSGTLTAVHLLRLQTEEPFRILLFERNPIMAKGAAYRTMCETHLLNVPMANMSAFPDEPSHLVDWCRGKLYPADPTAFMPRQRYGEYLGDVLFSAKARKQPQILFESRNESVIACHPEGAHAKLTLGNGETMMVDAVVLALGNFPPAELQLNDMDFLTDPRYHGDPWLTDVTAQVAQDDPVLIIGTGLTMVDMVLSLQAQGHTGPVTAISRHGYLPQPHQQYTPPASPVFPEAPGSRLSELFAAVREKLASADNWRAVIDGLRPHTQTLWQGLTVTEKRRFMRHVRPLWEIHRHRMAPQLWDTLHQCQQSGYLHIRRGRIQAITPTNTGMVISYTPHQANDLETIEVAHVFNCAGAMTHYARLDDPLIRQLMTGGHMVPDPLSLGVETDDAGALKNLQNQPSPCLYTLGPPLKGMLWETTAVPEIRGQAKQLAHHIGAKLLTLSLKGR